MRSLSLFFILASLAPAQQDRSDRYRGGLVTPPLLKPRFILTDTSGAPYDFWDRTEGSVALLFFGYANCPDQCPMHMANIGAALKKLPPGIAEQVKLVFVTTDPARDTTVGLRRWLDNLDTHFVASRELKLLSRQSRKPRGFPPPKKHWPPGTT
jgi:protein SCO1/2